MRYTGSKFRLSKHILPVILSYRQPGQLYVEPFVGSGSLFAKVDGPKIGSELNPYVVATLNAVAAGWVPPTDVSEAEYKAIKVNKDSYPPELVGFVGHACAFAGAWFETYARGGGQNYAREGSNKLVKTAAGLQGVVPIVACDYRKLSIPPASLVYCDPPYRQTDGRYKDAFDSDAFFQWVRKLSKRCTVLVSEYSAPGDFECVWEKEVTVRSTRLAGGSRVERLFKYDAPLATDSSDAKVFDKGEV